MCSLGETPEFLLESTSMMCFKLLIPVFYLTYF